MNIQLTNRFLKTELYFKPIIKNIYAHLPRANLSSWKLSDNFLRPAPAELSGHSATLPHVLLVLLCDTEVKDDAMLPNFVCKSSCKALRSADKSAPISADCRYDNTTLQQYVHTRRSPADHQFYHQYSLLVTNI
jgi:hypothetical protein